MTKLRISPAARMTTTSQGILLTSNLGTFQLQGSDVQVFAAVLEPLLDGTRDADAVAAALPGYSRSSVLSFLELLKQRGLVETVPEGLPPLAARLHPQDRFFASFGLDPATVAARLKNARVLLVGGEAWGAVAAIELAAAGVGALHLLDGETPLTAEDLLAVRAFTAADIGRPRVEALREAALRASQGSCQVTCGRLEVKSGRLRCAEAPFSLLLAALDGDDLYHLQATARFAQALGLPSLHSHLEGFEHWLGPAVMPGQTACWNCLRLRRLATAPVAQAAHEFDAARLVAPAPQRSHAFLAPMAAQTGSAIALEALRLLAAFTVSPLLGRFRVSHLLTQETSLHTLVPMPWCEVCGGAEALLEKGIPRGQPLQLEMVGDIASLRQVLAGWVDPRVGLIPLLHGASGDGGLAPPLTASANLAAYTEGRLDPSTAGQIGSGKGLTAVAAHIGAVGEAIERYSAARYRLSRLKIASFYELKEDKIDPRRLSLYEEAQYSEPGFPFPRFSTKKPIHWVRGQWLEQLAGPPVWVPALVAYFNFQPTSPAEYFCQVSSNGLAAGSSFEDAAFRATLELVERDAAMLTWLAQRPAPRIEPDSSLDAGSWQVLSQLTARGVQVELYHLDVGLGVPTVFCLGLGDGRAWPGVTVSLATHTDPRRAANKAILEQAHVGPYLSSLLPTARIPGSPAEVTTLEEHATYYFPPHRLVAFDFLRRSGLPPVRLAEIPDAGPPTAVGLAARLAAAGVRVAVVDVTSPDVALGPFRVARAVGLDLLPIHFGERLRRLANPRLKKLLGPASLNPHPHPIA